MVRFGEIRLRVMHTPGHTEGSVCLLAEDEGLLYSGDTLFAGGWGRVDLPGGDPRPWSPRSPASPGSRTGSASSRGTGAATTIGRERAWMELVRDGGRLFA